MTDAYYLDQLKKPDFEKSKDEIKQYKKDEGKRHP